MRSIASQQRMQGFSIAFYGETVEGRSLLDVRLRLLVRGRIDNLLLLAIPLREAQTGLRMAKLVHMLMTILCGASWKIKLVGYAPMVPGVVP